MMRRIFLNRIEHIKSGSASRLLFEFSVPSVIAMLSQGVCGIMERIYAGNGAGPLAISGITLAFPVVALYMAFGMMIGTGGAALYSVSMGKGRTVECRSILCTCFFMLGGVSLALSGVALLFFNELLSLSGAAGESHMYASQYLEILLFALPLQAVSFGMNNFIRSQGRPSKAMATILIASMGNILISPVFIFIMQMGVRGAALGYLSAQVLAALHVLIYFMRTPATSTDLQVRWRPELSVIRRIIVSGTGPFFMQLCAVAVAASYNRQLLHYGTESDLSVFGILRCISVFLLLPALAISQAAQPVIGCSHGSGNSARVGLLLARACTASVLIPCAGVLAVLFFPDAVTGLFTGSDAIRHEAGVNPLRTFILLLPLAGLQVCAGSYFLVTGRPLHSAILTLSRQALFLVPLLFMLPLYFGVYGVWLAQPVSDAAAFIFASVMLNIDRKRKSMGVKGGKSSGLLDADSPVLSAGLCCVK